MPNADVDHTEHVEMFGRLVRRASGYDRSSALMADRIVEGIVATLIERLRHLPVDALGDFVAESERAGSRLVRRLVDEWISGANRFEGRGEALFGAWVDGRLVGVCGLNVDPYSAEDRVGRVRHLYVLSAFRRLGVGRQLVSEVVAAAQGTFDMLRLSTGNQAAARLYEGLGFRPSGEAVGDATHVKELASGAGKGGACHGRAPLGSEGSP